MRRRFSLSSALCAAFAVIMSMVGLGGAFADDGGVTEIVDLRVGENDTASRLVIVCGEPCMAEQDEAGFRLYGVTGDMMVDLSGRKGFLRSVSLEPKAAGSELTIITAKRAQSITIADCGSDTQICIDFLKPGAAIASTAVTPNAAAALKTPELPRAEIRPETKIATKEPTALAMPEIRDTPTSGKPISSKIVPPQIVTAQSDPIDAVMDDLTKAPTLRDASNLRDVTASTITPTSNPQKPITTQTASIGTNSLAGKTLTMDTGRVAFLAERTGLAITPQACSEAQETLQQDAWDLLAYRRFALCLAAAGATEQAYGLLLRLEKYKPGDVATMTARQAVLQLTDGPALAEDDKRPSLR